MASHTPAPPPLRLLQSRARSPVRQASQPAPTLAWWQRLLPWSATRSA
jgi:hypothetical protein